MTDGTQGQQQNQQQGQGQNQQQNSAPWYEGKADAEIIGYWQNKGWDASDPAKLAIETSKAARAAQQHIGHPVDLLLKLPAPDSSPGTKAEVMKAVWQRLGVPAEAKDYDFSGVKNLAGEPIDGRLADTLRAEMHARNVPKDAAVEIAKALVKHQDSLKTEQDTVAAGKIAEEKAKLAANWKGKEDINLLQARVGAERLGLTPEDVAALEKSTSYAKTMEALRRVGALSAEDKFIEGGEGQGTPATRQGAVARKSELMADKAWVNRFLSGDITARREMEQLERQITGITEQAA